MTVLITLTTAGADSGPFNLYSNLDGYTSAFATGVSKSALLAGYSSASVPDYTTIIRVISTGNCTNYIDIILNATTTTSTSSTTTTAVPTTTTTTTIICTQYSASADGFPGNVYYTDCSGSIEEIFVDTTYTFCATQGTVTSSGPIISIVGPCPI